MPRLLFSKLDESIWMSHLDLMRLFQRAFKRAGLPLTHTKGFNPRPSVSIALPLSVGVESRCELLDFDLEGEAISCEEIMARLNPALVRGVEVLGCYDDGKKLKELAYLSCKVSLEYDRGIPSDAEATLSSLFASSSLVVEKKSKNGTSDQDIIPMLRGLTVSQADSGTLVLSAKVCCQNPSLNPAQLVAAIEKYAPAYIPDHYRICREEIYDTKDKIFR